VLVKSGWPGCFHGSTRHNKFCEGKKLNGDFLMSGARRGPKERRKKKEAGRGLRCGPKFGDSSDYLGNVDSRVRK
jgi:hypothetical protein